MRSGECRKRDMTKKREIYKSGEKEIHNIDRWIKSVRLIVSDGTVSFSYCTKKERGRYICREKWYGILLVWNLLE